MRDLAKSMLGLSWAVGLYGMQQFTKALTRSETLGASAAQLDDLSQTVQQHLSEPFAEQFRAAQEWQHKMVDAMFDATSPATFDPRGMMSTLDPRAMFEGGMNLLQHSVQQIRK